MLPRKKSPASLLLGRVSERYEVSEWMFKIMSDAWNLILATHPEAKIRFHASDMILNTHSDASYLSETRSRSRPAGYCFLGSKVVKKEKSR